MGKETAALGYVVKAAQEREVFGGMLSAVRRLNENDKDTLQRLIDERRALVCLCEELKVPHRNIYDSAYKDGDIVDRLRRTLSVVCFSLVHEEGDTE